MKRAILLLLLISAAILLLLLISAPAGAQTLSDNGLETANYKYVAVVVERLSASYSKTVQGLGKRATLLFGAGPTNSRSSIATERSM